HPGAHGEPHEERSRAGGPLLDDHVRLLVLVVATTHSTLPALAVARSTAMMPAGDCVSPSALPTLLDRSLRYRLERLSRRDYRSRRRRTQPSFARTTLLIQAGGAIRGGASIRRPPGHRRPVV